VIEGSPVIAYIVQDFFSQTSGSDVDGSGTDMEMVRPERSSDEGNQADRGNAVSVPSAAISCLSWIGRGLTCRSSSRTARSQRDSREGSLPRWIFLSSSGRERKNPIRTNRSGPPRDILTTSTMRKKMPLSRPFFWFFPGSEEAYTIKQFSDAIREYQSIGHHELMEHLHAFLKEIIPAVEESAHAISARPWASHDCRQAQAASLSRVFAFWELFRNRADLSMGIERSLTE